MNIVGNKGRVAVQYCLAEHYQADWLYGNFCFFLGGVTFGKCDLITSLRDALFQLEEQAWASGRRFNRRFDSLPSVEVFKMIDGALFGEIESEYEALAEEEQWACHSFLPSVDVFNYCKAYCIESDQGGRIIFSKFPYETVNELIVDAGELDLVLGRLRRELDELYRREMRKER